MKSKWQSETELVHISHNVNAAEFDRFIVLNILDKSQNTKF